MAGYAVNGIKHIKHDDGLKTKLKIVAGGFGTNHILVRLISERGKPIDSTLKFMGKHNQTTDIV